MESYKGETMGRNHQRYLIRVFELLATIGLILMIQGCAASSSTNDSGYRKPVYVDPSRTNPIMSGIGLEPQDMAAIADLMVRDVLASPQFSTLAYTPRIIVDDTRFKNTSSQILDVNLIIDELRTGLVRSAAGRMLFISRQNFDLVEHERNLKKEGEVDKGATDLSVKKSGADFQLVGRIGSQESLDPSTGINTHFFQFYFEILDLTTGVTVWAGPTYKVEKTGSDNVIYR
jgi:penicillin-binding protein activator